MSTPSYSNVFYKHPYESYIDASDFTEMPSLRVAALLSGMLLPRHIVLCVDPAGRDKAVFDQVTGRLRFEKAIRSLEQDDWALATAWQSLPVSADMKALATHARKRHYSISIFVDKSAYGPY